MPDTANSVYFQLFKEIGILEQLSRAFLEARLPDGLIAPHFGVLNHLISVGDGSTPVELARTFQVPKTSMTHTLAGLEKHGLVEMRPNPADGRSKKVWLKPEGRKMRDATIAALGPEFEGIATAVSLGEVEQVLPILTKLRVFLDNARN
ncbi:MarR family transcriptional regulator [Litoreibacter meonggei]|uniref:MarR family transcriptional regulator n=1 Tax=Litoreibacter meonggei TaxID=1049199 RepID=A0A497WR86_9RHOB|nr:MarR family transcriptional regulator [Litoreibacter meonggei]RLJ51543.1 MarR family transcriptional regulator [Litoreibacter meonggei]